MSLHSRLKDTLGRILQTAGAGRLRDSEPVSLMLIGFLIGPEHAYLEVRFGAGGGDNCTSGGSEFDAEGDLDFLGFVGNVAYFLDDVFGDGQDFVERLFNGLFGLVQFFATCCADSAADFGLIDFYDNAAPTLQGECYQVFHGYPPYFI